jgi:hypothetical protein
MWETVRLPALRAVGWLENAVRDVGVGGSDLGCLVALRRGPALRAQLAAVKKMHDADMGTGAGAVALPGALERKYPSASHAWSWPWVLPATRPYSDSDTGEKRRHRLHETVIQRAVRHGRHRNRHRRPRRGDVCPRPFRQQNVSSGSAFNATSSARLQPQFAPHGHVPLLGLALHRGSGRVLYP